MAPLAVRDTNQTSRTPSLLHAWHVGISPVFPSSLILSKDAAIQAVLTDIPFLSVGLLGFGVLTFFFAMRKFNRLSFIVFASVIMAFIAGVLDVGQVLIRGKNATDSDTNVSSVLPLLVGREIILSISIGIRFLFFWAFVSRPPRGERCVRPRNDLQEQRPSFLPLESDIHSGSWVRLGYAGDLLKYSLLLAVLFIPILQILWRVVGDFSKFGPVYDADSALEIAISVLVIIKLFMNAWLSPLAPQWKTIRDYSPVISASLIGLGVAVGNTLQFQFSETSLGRFFQAIELYILVLYIHIASFYERRSILDPTMQNRASKTSMPPAGIAMHDRTSTTQTNPAITLAPRTDKVYPFPSNRLSSWLVPDADQAPILADAPRRMSTADRITSWITSRRGSTSQYQERSRLHSDGNVESGTSLVHTNARLLDATESFTATSWKYSRYLLPASVPPASQRLQRLTRALDAPVHGKRNGAVSPDGTISSFAAVDNYRRNDFAPPKLPSLPGSPVYGLDGIVRYHGRSSSPLPQHTPSSRHSSVQSAGMQSLLRQQAELDKTVAELQLFSPVSPMSSERLVVPGGQSMSLQSDFSLSNFPDPPPDLPSRPVDTDVEDNSRFHASDVDPLQGANVAAVPPPPVAPQIYQSTVQSQRQSLSSTSTRTSGDSAVLGIASRTVVGSGGTQYDVTSFIGRLYPRIVTCWLHIDAALTDLTKPTLKESFSSVERRPLSLVMGQPDAGDVPAANARPAADITPSGTMQTSQAPAFAVIPEVGANSTTKLLVPRRMKQGLPSGIKMNISGPIRQPSVERPTAYERPRRVPPPVPHT
ncbi:hypothetical protein JB92DRAFT_3134555 [Gautieria morchelliformis]|nr:hypothetical protein JB92DRAFT_3134555 [Gautieria morchelliformis]